MSIKIVILKSHVLDIKSIRKIIFYLNNVYSSLEVNLVGWVKRKDNLKKYFHELNSTLDNKVLLSNRASFFLNVINLLKFILYVRSNVFDLAILPIVQYENHAYRLVKLIAAFSGVSAIQFYYVESNLLESKSDLLYWIIYRLFLTLIFYIFLPLLIFYLIINKAISIK